MLSGDEDFLQNTNTNNNYSDFPGTLGTYYIHIFLENTSI
jgi:hypothetical protein